jgi:exodeoxyribonuclease-5
MATRVREGGRLDLGRYGESQVVAACDIENNDTADQIIVGCNDTRRAVNSWRRKKLGLTDPLPMVGDRLVCLRNNHGKGLLNGSLWDVEDVQTEAGDFYLTVKPDDGGDAIEVTTHAAFFNASALPERRAYDEFTYGYALTAHKAQGSQWDSVLILDESTRFRADASRWLYTAITRASKRVTVVRRDASHEPSRRRLATPDDDAFTPEPEFAP